MVVGDTPDQRLAVVADAQHGRIARAQLVAIGFTAAMIKTRLRAGQLRRIHHGVYAVGHALDVAHGAEAAALLAIRPAIGLSHRSGAALFAMVDRPPPEVDIVVVGHVRSRPGIRIHRSSNLQRVDLTRRHGLPVTTPARILLDLASTEPLRLVEQALDVALGSRLVSPTKIREAVARAPGLSGGGLLMALLDPDRAKGITRSQAEERMLALIRSAGLPDPERNARIGPYEVDFLWREQGLVVEVDSYAWHSGPWAFKRDRRKDAYLAQRQLELHRVTWEMMDEPLALIARIARRV